MEKKVLLSLLLFAQLCFANQEQAAAENVELIVSTNEHDFSICSKSLQNCTIQVSGSGCLSPAGSVTITNTSRIVAKNISASSVDPNFINYIVQNNHCPTSLAPGASCSISFTTNTSVAFSVTNVMVKGTNTNATFFDINTTTCASTGALEPTPGSPVLTGNHASNLDISPNSQFLYVSGYNGTVAGFNINGTTGALTPVLGSPFPGGSQFTAVAVSPNGNFAYVTDNANSRVVAYSINPSTGALTTIFGSPFTGVNGPNDIAISPNGNFAYVVNQNDNTISAFTLNTLTGAMTPIGSPINAGGNPYAVAVSPNGSFVYAVNFYDGTISQYTINPITGALTPILGGAVPTGSYPVDIVVSPNNQFVFVAAANGMGYSLNGFDTSIWIYSVNSSTGALTDVTPIVPSTPSSAVAITPDGKFVYEASYQTDQLIADSVDQTTGALTTLPQSPYSTGNGPSAIGITANGKFVYVVNINDNSISGFSIH